MNLSRVSNSPKKRFQLSVGLNIEKLKTNFNWNQPYLSRGLNSLNSGSVLLFVVC